MHALGPRFALVFLLLGASLLAQSGGLTVVGEGRAERPADRVEIRGTYEARAELPGDAFVKFAQASKRLAAKFGELEIPRMTITRRGMQVGVGFAGADEGGVNNVVIMGMGGGEKPLDPEVVIRERFVLSFPLAELGDQERHDAIARVVEICREMGVKHPGGQGANEMLLFAAMTNQGPPDVDAFELAGAVSFHASDPSALYRAATKAALEEARARAAIQAELVTRQLGGVLELMTLEGERVGPSKSMLVRHRMKLQVRFELR